ncbi:hypothetical protein LWI29_006666 [Acer saccharum]|uniref:Uncharacterized protein n=1 Tax=Acer saccharum TaxID=4024 RepID=A0AA39SUA9_ACESA|nr:hypothetical protein LWI29_006666 [Acer saccharum]
MVAANRMALRLNSKRNSFISGENLCCMDMNNGLCVSSLARASISIVAVWLGGVRTLCQARRMLENKKL